MSDVYTATDENAFRAVALIQAIIEYADQEGLAACVVLSPDVVKEMREIAEAVRPRADKGAV